MCLMSFSSFGKIIIHEGLEEKTFHVEGKIYLRYEYKENNNMKNALASLWVIGLWLFNIKHEKGARLCNQLPPF